jgi:MtN3 and saliva related transmembrane protein
VVALLCRQPAIHLGGDAQPPGFPERIASPLSQRHLARFGDHFRRSGIAAPTRPTASMQYGIYILGMLAAALTSLSYLPQLQKAMPRNSTSDLSLKMLVALSAGLCLWIVYGVLKADCVIILANSIGATLSLAVLAFKIRDLNS